MFQMLKTVYMFSVQWRTTPLCFLRAVVQRQTRRGEKQQLYAWCRKSLLPWLMGGLIVMWISVRAHWCRQVWQI